MTYQVFLNACEDGDFETVNKMICASVIDCRDKDGRTTLMVAALHSHSNIIEKLVTSGADISLKDNEGRNAYIRLIENNNVPMIYLLNPGIIDQSDDLGCTLLIKMCDSIRMYPENEDDILFLYDKGADIFKENNTGVSAYDILLKNSLPEKLRSFVDKIKLLQNIEDEVDDMMRL